MNYKYFVWIFSSSRSKTIKQVVDLKKEIKVNIPSDLVGLEKKISR